MRQRLPTAAEQKTGAVSTAALAALVLFVSGCGLSPQHDYDEEQTVKVEVTGIADEAQRGAISRKLQGMLEGPARAYSMAYAAGTLRASLAPVSDVEAFAERIEFGTVTAVDGRTVTVDASAGAADWAR